MHVASHCKQMRENVMLGDLTMTGSVDTNHNDNNFSCYIVKTLIKYVSDNENLMYRMMTRKYLLIMNDQ